MGASRADTTQAGDRYWLHALLFVITLASTVFAGGQLVGRYDFYAQSGSWISAMGARISIDFLLDGLRFGGSLLLFLTVHEFGHYFAARFHRVRTSLPFYIPFPFNGIGTFGAVIRIRESVPSMTKLFDIGAAGPIAGFIVALVVLLAGLFTLPSPEYIFGLSGHELLKQYIQLHGVFPPDLIAPPSSGQEMNLVVGTTPLYWILSHFFQNVPPMWEVYHYPVLFAGWLGLFFTALNLLPVGQLDGGHMLYALIGPKWHSRVARTFVLVLLVSGSIGFVSEAPILLGLWLPAPDIGVWIILAGILLFFSHRIFGNDIRLVIGGLFGVISLSALGSGVPTVVDHFGYSGWLFWCLLIVLLIRVDHPPVLIVEPLSRNRRILAILGIIIFVLCFSFKPLYFT